MQEKTIPKIPKLNSISEHNLRVSPFHLSDLKELKITSKINEHIEAHLVGQMSGKPDDHLGLLDKLCEEHPLEISFMNGTNLQVLFTGMVTNLEIQNDGDINYLMVDALSNTYALDIVPERRVYQDSKVTYRTILQQIADEHGASISDHVTNNAALGKFTMRYQETDWQFLKRLASRFHTGLVANLGQKPSLSFGITESQQAIKEAELMVTDYKIGKELKLYKYQGATGSQKNQDEYLVYYEIETQQRLNIGDKVEFRGKILFVAEMSAILERGYLKLHYRLVPKEGLWQATLYNQRLIGLGQGAEVIAVEQDQVKLHFDASDEVSKEKAWLFPYTTVYARDRRASASIFPK